MLSASIKPSLYRLAASANNSAPRHLGTRYNRQGHFLLEPGNTVVCHLVSDSASQRAVTAVRERLLAMPDTGRFIFTPVSSLHMTLFQGVIEYRRHWPYWPRDPSSATSIDAMTEFYRRRLSDFGQEVPFKVRTIDVTPTELVVEGVTARDKFLLNAWRDALSLPFGYRHPDHDDYKLHITLSYPIEWLPDERLQAWQAVLDDCLALMEREAPILELRTPAFCRFDNMEHFEELVVLG